MKRLLGLLIFFPAIAWAQTAPVEPLLAPVAMLDADGKSGSPCIYPDVALQSRATGRTDLRFHVGNDGAIADVQVIYPSGNADLDAAAIQCVSRTHIDPKLGVQAGLVNGSVTWIVPSPIGPATPRPIGLFNMSRAEMCGSDWYPPAAIAANAQGTATVAVHITQDGTVRGADLVKSAGNADLDRATVDCVTRGAHFRPALDGNGRPVEVTKEYAIQWAMDAQAPVPIIPEMPVAQSVAELGPDFGAPCTYAQLMVPTNGTTSLLFHVSADGKVGDTTVVFSSGHSELDAAAVECANSWQAARRQARIVLGRMSWSMTSPSSSASDHPVGRFDIPPLNCTAGYYPPAAVRAGAEGTVQLGVHVTATGTVGSVDVVHSTGNRDLDEMAAACVMQKWRFRPTMENGKPVAMSKVYAIKFGLR